MNHSIVARDVDEMGSYYSAYLETKCNLNLNLKEKK